MHPSVISAHAETLSEWADIWEREARSEEATSPKWEVVELLRKVNRRIRFINGERDAIQESESEPDDEGSSVESSSSEDDGNIPKDRSEIRYG